MLQATPSPKEDREGHAAPASKARPLSPKEVTPGNGLGAQKLMNAVPVMQRRSSLPLQTRVPVILGEATFRGMIAADGIINGQPGNSGGSMSVRQHNRTAFGAEPELNGEIRFVDMIRVIGHIAGSVHSKKGTLIVDTAARVDANVDVAIAVISGTVSGDIVAHQRVELAPSAKIYGNIWTRSLAIQSGAIFEGVCQMLDDKKDS